jgi:cold shock protein
VKWFNAEEGLGFIVVDGGGADLFVHYAAIADTGGYRSLAEDQRVVFEATQGEVDHDCCPWRAFRPGVVAGRGSRRVCVRSK